MPGVITIGGGRMQYQVLVDPVKLLGYDLPLRDVMRAAREANHLWPVMTYSSPSRTARVLSEARSVPALGSE